MHIHTRLTTAGLFCSLTALASAADPVAWLPGEVNAVARINVADIYQTPLAKQEGWLRKATESFIQQEAFIPPGVNQILIGSNLNLVDNLSSDRKYTVLVPDSTMTMEKLADWLPGGIEKIADKPAGQFSSDGYVVDAGDGCWLATTQSSRQQIARWLRTGPATGASQLTPYLKSALTAKTNTAQTILAIDLRDNFSKARVEDQLKETDWFSSPVAAGVAAEVLSSVNGITISITVDQARVGAVDIEFGREATPLKPVLDKLVGAVLQRVGAASDDFTEWQWTVKGSHVTGTGPVSPGGGRRLISLLDPPSITQVISSSSDSADNKVAATSQKYCKSIRVLLDDLRGTLRKTRDNHALWFERYARKIDDLPRLNVDGELLDYSAKVSNSLRYQSQVQRMSNIQGGTRMMQSGAYQTTVAISNFAGPFNGDGWNSSSTAQAAGTINAEQNEAARDVRFAEWKQIEDGLAEIRRKMTEKYQLEF